MTEEKISLYLKDFRAQQHIKCHTIRLCIDYIEPQRVNDRDYMELFLVILKMDFKKLRIESSIINNNVIETLIYYCQNTQISHIYFAYDVSFNCDPKFIRDMFDSINNNPYITKLTFISGDDYFDEYLYLPSEFKYIKKLTVNLVCVEKAQKLMGVIEKLKIDYYVDDDSESVYLIANGGKLFNNLLANARSCSRLSKITFSDRSLRNILVKRKYWPLLDEIIATLDQNEKNLIAARAKYETAVNNIVQLHTIGDVNNITSHKNLLQIISQKLSLTKDDPVWFNIKSQGIFF